jgi:ubiquinone/menaquinone biosynthesis C-methylase UbiE
MSGLKTHYAAFDIEARILAGIRAAGLNPEQRLSAEELGALDHFHTGGLRASHELLAITPIEAGDRVIDVGAGLAGSARMLASQIGCRVECIEMSADYCIGARLLNRLTGLEDRIKVHEGSALDLPFVESSFDVAWMQNVGMNIADKQTLYAEIARVLKPGGLFAFQEMAAGTATELFEDTSNTHLSRTSAHANPAAPGQLGLAVFVNNLAEKAANARRSLEEGQVRLVRGVCRLN